MSVQKRKQWVCLDMNETKHNQNTHRASGEQVHLGKAIMRVLIGKKHESDAQKAGNKQKNTK